MCVVGGSGVQDLSATIGKILPVQRPSPFLADESHQTVLFSLLSWVLGTVPLTHAQAAISPTGEISTKFTPGFITRPSLARARAALYCVLAGSYLTVAGRINS